MMVQSARRACLILTVLSLLSPSLAGAEEFVYRYATGDKFRVLSVADEDVFINRQFSHSARIMNRIAWSVTKAENGSGTLSGTFQTLEKGVTGSRNVYELAEEYASVYTRSARGVYDIAPEYWMPVVRDVPVFPEGDLQPGATWSHAGEEVHDLRRGFGIQKPYRIPFTANYRYIGTTQRNGRDYALVTVSYRIFDEPQRPEGSVRVWPVRIMAASDQRIYWDRELGQPAAYEEEFRIIFEVSSGDTFEYRGTASSELVEAAPMDRARIASEIQGEIDRLGIRDAKVSVAEEGVVITLDNIQFSPDSAELLESERVKLDRIAQILGRYPDRDLLVAGHTALAGTEQARMALSLQRAGVVADYLILKGVRSNEQIIVKGYGAGKPVAPNSTEEGMRKNRRVELVLLEN